MKTRVATQLDVISLRRLDTDGRVVLAPSPLDDGRGVLAAVLVPGGERTWIAENEGPPPVGVVGFAQARPRRYVLGWELTRVRVRRDQEAQDVLAALIQEILQYLQDRGIPRLFARTPEDSYANTLLTGCGFTQLLSETVFVRRPSPARPPVDTPVGMRYRMPQDAWPLRQLENSQTPLLISQLEGLTSSSWTMPKHRLSRREEPADLVIERNGEIVGWVGWSFVPAGHGMSEHTRLAIMTDAQHTELAAPLLDYALYVVGSKHPASEIIVRLRDYQHSIRPALEDRGFVESARYVLHIKHGRLQVAAQPAGKLFELAPKAHAFAVEPLTATRYRLMRLRQGPPSVLDT
jgi:N-acetylglutamate synthase-like GNAT family acetyltransferase